MLCIRKTKKKEVMKLFSYLILFVLTFEYQTYSMSMLTRVVRCTKLVHTPKMYRAIAIPLSHLRSATIKPVPISMRLSTFISKAKLDVVNAILEGNIKDLLKLYVTQPTVFQEKRDGLTPLQFAATRPDNLAVIEFLIAAGASVDAQTNTGDTALHLAAQCNNKKAIKLLLAHGADASIKNKSGKIALEQSNIPFDYLLES